MLALRTSFNTLTSGWAWGRDSVRFAHTTFASWAACLVPTGGLAPLYKCHDLTYVRYTTCGFQLRCGKKDHPTGWTRVFQRNPRASWQLVRKHKGAKHSEARTSYPECGPRFAVVLWTTLRDQPCPLLKIGTGSILCGPLQ